MTTERRRERALWLSASTERIGTHVARECDVCDDPGREVDRRAKAAQAEDPGLEYGEAMRKVLANDPQLKEVYASGPRSEPDARVEAGLEVDRRAKAHIAEYGCKYPTAMWAVLQADPDLKRRYAGV